MDYSVMPFAAVWKNGIFNLPTDIVDKYLKMASEYQLKALLYIIRHEGRADSASVAKALGQTVGDIESIMEFWLSEGVVVADGCEIAPPPAPVTEPAEEKAEKTVPKHEMLAAPRLSPKDVAAFAAADQSISFLLSDAQRVLGRTISHAEQEMLVNMVQYYGLKVEVILMILEFYRSEKQRGKAIGISYVNAMAKNWADEGINSITDAEAKLQDIARSDRLWNEIVAITGIRHRRPTAKQREMVYDWFKDFDVAMITLAADIMKENTAEPSLAYVNKILKQWKKKNITSPAQVKAEQEAFEKSKANKKSDKLKSKPSYDLEKVMSDAMNNTDIV